MSIAAFVALNAAITAANAAILAVNATQVIQRSATPESQALRDGIRSGAIRCRTPLEGGRCDHRNSVHEMDCVWERALARIYEVERAAEQGAS